MSTEANLPTMPEHARLWVFAADRPLEEAERQTVRERVRAFVEEWHAHGRPVVGAFDLLHDRFLLVAADEEATGVSGCSIDSLYRVLQEVEREVGLNLLDSSLVHFRDAGGAIRSVGRGEFRELVQGGVAGDDTTVFDNTVATVGQLRAGAWERPMRDSWHARAFAPRGSAAAGGA